MKLLETFSDYCNKADNINRSVFEAAMIERLKKEPPFKMSDLLYQVCECQGHIEVLQEQIEMLTARFDKKATKKTKEPKKDGNE